MLFFSTLNPNYITNNPIKGTISLDLVCYQKSGLVKEFDNFSSAQLIFKKMEKKEFTKLRGVYPALDPKVQSQVSTVIIPAFGRENWNISLPRLKFLRA